MTRGERFGIVGSARRVSPIFLGKWLLKVITHIHTALRNYEGRVTSYADELVSQLDASRGKAVNATHWFNSYAFDVIGDLAFGRSFDMLKTGEKVVPIKTFIRFD